MSEVQSFFVGERGKDTEWDETNSYPVNNYEIIIIDFFIENSEH